MWLRRRAMRHDAPTRYPSPGSEEALGELTNDSTHLAVCSISDAQLRYSSAEGTDCFKSRKGAAKVGQMMIQHDKSTCCNLFLYSSS
ncbi:unnamed protein product [Sphagnum jensenii]|uniref:Uncharacterized protein n=1 Tax=Sphagnum jensenii TaxID=128206 RepID=A0ABP1BDA3_9BRYO